MRRRQGLTLVELLVATALILFMMVILSEALSIGLEGFRRLKAIGDINANLRTAATILRSDLTADHFEGRKRLSDTSLWSTSEVGGGPPREGFFRIWQGSTLSLTNPGAPYARESADTGGDRIPLTRATDHMLHFTIKLRGNYREHFFMARVPQGSPLLTVGKPDGRYQDSPDTYSCQWAEVAYFLRPNGAFAGATPLYALYRRQRLLVPENQEINWGANRVPASELGNYRDISCTVNPQDNGFLYFNSPIDITVPQRRFGMGPEDGGLPTERPDPNDSRTWTYPTLADEDPARAGDDLLLTDVLSFEVKHSTSSDFVDNLLTSSANDLFRDVAASGGRPAQLRPRVFDTWSSVVDGAYDYSRWSETGTTTNRAAVHIPNRTSIRALMITIRVWDAKTLQARQMTLIQDM